MRPSADADAVPARHDFQAWIDRLDDELIGVAMTLVDLLPRATRAVLAADHVDAWRQRDGLAVHEVDRCDEAVDRLQVQLLRGVRRDVSGSTELLILGLLARYFERIADHGVAFAQHAAFAVTGTRVDVGRGAT